MVIQLMPPLIQIKNLNISFLQKGNTSLAVDDISFDIPAGKITSLIGESGSGKSLTALSILNLLPTNAITKGEIIFTQSEESSSINLLLLGKKALQKIRGNTISMIFQEPMTSLNPLHTCGSQVMESLKLHKKLSNEDAKNETISLFEKCELPNPSAIINRYPHQLSGGQKQRVMIAMAMSCKPTLLIADEPTTALDVRVQKKILLLLKKLQAENNMAILFITHDLSLVKEIADEVLVMSKGKLVEIGNAKEVLLYPKHHYTKALLNCIPTAKSKGKRLATIEELNLVENETILEKKEFNLIISKAETVLSVENLSVVFATKKNIFGKITASYKAVDNVSFDVIQNEIIGLVGESGCGKTTIGRAILNLIKPTSGNIHFGNKNIITCTTSEIQLLRKELQIVFQDPYGSLNPRLSIGDAIAEPMQVHNIIPAVNNRKEKVIDLLEQVNMKADDYKKYPHQFSGGQRQRICIARALAVNPSFLIFDESVSALDVSVQAQVLNLINDLKNRFQFSAIFISHNLSVVHYISDRIMVMKNGQIVESGLADDIMFSPKDKYTKALLDAMPSL